MSVHVSGATGRVVLLFLFQRPLPFPHGNVKPPLKNMNFTISRQIGYGTTDFYKECFKNLSKAKKTFNGLNKTDILRSSTKFFYHIQQELLKLPLLLKLHSVNIVRVCTQQCEFVIAHKLRRSQQIFSLYTKLWDEMALKQFVMKLHQQIFRPGRSYMLSAAGLSAFNWSDERISDKEIFKHVNDLAYIKKLVIKTMTCNACRLRQVVNNSAVANKEYCKCKGSASVPALKKSFDSWVPFLEGDDLLCWKKEQNGVFTYKMYGTYDDVTAEDFLQVQLDVEYRKEWDPTVAALNVIEKDPDSDNDVVYWEMEWPRLFANRDYVFIRRFVVDHEKKIMLIVSKGTSHPNYPEVPEKFRVKDYWSFMVIRPFTEFNEPGIEFSLTYYDNPGITIPSTVTSWVAMRGLPNFLKQVRVAAREINAKRLLTETEFPTTPAREEPPDVEGMPPPPPPTTSLPLSVQDPQTNQLSNGNNDAYFQQFRVLFI